MKITRYCSTAICIWYSRGDKILVDISSGMNMKWIESLSFAQNHAQIRHIQLLEMNDFEFGCWYSMFTRAENECWKQWISRRNCSALNAAHFVKISTDSELRKRILFEIESIIGFNYYFDALRNVFLQKNILHC